MKKIYIITAGHYSDYRILAVYDDKILADKFLEIVKASMQSYDDPQIEEWDLNPYKVGVRKGYNVFFVRMKKDGEVLETEATTVSCRSEVYFDTKGNLVMDVWAKDSQHAIKIVNEKRGQLLAEDLWGKEIGE